MKATMLGSGFFCLYYKVRGLFIYSPSLGRSKYIGLQTNYVLQECFGMESFLLSTKHPLRFFINNNIRKILLSFPEEFFRSIKMSKNECLIFAKILLFLFQVYPDGAVETSFKYKSGKWELMNRFPRSADSTG